ncbi:hypothetical protein DTO166G4_6761 [Paecilomyces variotii]|nr:hypothetical protein DTO166G4_6761 [Paecilomyces variotii]KAJ9238659.1 hypothetical protein DTO166G5_2780 [Paecilomyces variotii]
MTRAAAPPTLVELQNPESLGAQTAALRRLKNELIGHDQRKEAWIGWGIIPVLSRVLSIKRGSGKRATAGELNGAGEHSDKAGRTEEEEACIQAVIILGSLAQGGPAFISPILSSEVPSHLLAIIAAPDCPQSLALAILKTLNAIADRLPLQSQQQWPKDTRLADLAFSKEYIGCLPRIIGQNSSSSTTQSCIALAASLIAKLCTEERHKTALADAGVLDALAVRVASVVVAQGFVLPGAEEHVRDPGALGALPAPAPPGAKLGSILRAVSAIIEHSKWRAEHFLSSPGIVTVFPKQLPEFAPNDIKKAPWGSTYLSGFAVPRHISLHPIDSILPSVPVGHAKSSSNFPPLGPQGSYGKHSHFYNSTFSFLESATSDDDENAIVPWLLYLVRQESGIVRLMAARLVTVLFRLGLAKRHRISMFGYLLIPILIRMLDKDYELPHGYDSEQDGLIPTTLRLKEEAPSILAMLVMDEDELQRAAVEGGAIKRLSQMLKETYNPFQDNTKAMWSAETGSPEPRHDVSPELQLGPPGYSPMVCHIMRYREGILKALASLAPSKDEYRKAVCDNGVVPYIIDSLKPRLTEAPDTASAARNTAADGNPTPTLLAACGAARMLTRSVSVLRTSLIDAGVATPLFELIKHRDIDVQIAATSVICNLALDFSPMKEAIISADILPILIDHAHSSNVKLRMESLWALKHVAYNSANDLKIKIIESLGPGWIKQIISQDPTHLLNKQNIDEEIGNGSPLGMGTSNSAGERVDLLNPIDDEEDEDLKMTDSIPTSKMSLEMFLPDPARRRKLALSGDLDQRTQARQDDIAVQEQTFDLLRNIICGSGASEMIDYLFKEIGQNDLFDAIADKLRPRTVQVSGRRDSTTNKSVPVPTEIIIAVTYVIIHLAAGLPRHRQLLALHPDILRFLMGFFNHSNPKVRVNCVWIVINLTYLDNESDRQTCRERAVKLKYLGVTDRLASLEDDPDLDVRERTKTALHLMDSLVSV